VAVITNPEWLAVEILAKMVVSACRHDVGVVEEGVECQLNNSSSSRLIPAYARWDIQAKTVR